MSALHASVELTTLANGLRVVSEAHAAPADGLPSASGSTSARATSRPRSTASPTCSSTWRSRAPRAAPPAPSPRRSSASAAASTPTPRASTPPTTPGSWPPTSSSPPTSWPTSSSTRRFDPAELEKERHVVLQEIGQVKDTPDDLVFDLLQEASYPDQPMGRAILGPEAIVAAMPREALIDYMARHYGPGGWSSPPPARSSTPASSSSPSACSATCRATDPSPPEPARYSGGRSRAPQRPRAGPPLPGVEGAALHRPRPFRACRCFRRRSAAACPRACSRRRARTGACATRSSPSPRAYADTGHFGVYAGTDPEDVPELCRSSRPRPRALVDDPSEDEIARARAQLKASLLMALRAAPPSARSWPASSSASAAACRPRKSWPASTPSTPPPSAASAAASFGTSRSR